MSTGRSALNRQCVRDLSQIVPSLWSVLSYFPISIFTLDIQFMNKKMRNLHLIISAILIVAIAFAYGIAPGALFPALFDFKVETTDLHNIFRSIMCLYIGMVILWVAGIFKPRYWNTATMVNIIFMSGLALGRLISFAADGIPSITLLIGFFVEVSLGALSYFNWKKYRVR